jgi:hypothetical protein
MKTESAIAAMLTENTGRHFLDSGGAYGRNWERNQNRAFEAEPATTLSFRYGEIEVTHNVFHFLKEKLSYDEDGNRALRCLDRYLRLVNFHTDRGRDYDSETHAWTPAKNGEGPDVGTLREEFPEFFRAWKARKDEADRDDCADCNGTGEVKQADAEGKIIVDADDVPIEVPCEVCKGRGWIHSSSIKWSPKKGIVAESPYEVGSFGEGGPPITCNTYNEECLLSQTLLFTYFELENEEYVVLQIHGGCDVRGGYTMPQVFTCSDEQGIFDFKRAGIGCTGEGPFVRKDTGQLAIPGTEVKETPFHEHNWSTDDGHSWYDNGSCGGGYVNLEDVGFVCIDPEAYEAALKDGAEPDEHGIVEGDDRWTKNLAKTWIRNRVCFVQDEIEIDGEKIEAGTGFCPHCGGRLAAGMY